jgi:hypothetical protein
MFSKRNKGLAAPVAGGFLFYGIGLFDDVELCFPTLYFDPPDQSADATFFYR